MAIGVAVIVAVVVFGVIFPQLVDWRVVWDVLGQVSALDLLVIFGLGLLRYWPSGWIYSLVLPGLSVGRGTRAWVASSGVASTLPGFDLVVRAAMYRSWGFSVERTMSGMFLSGVVEMSARLSIAAVAVLVWGVFTFELNAFAIGGIALLAFFGIAAFVRALLRSEDRARRVGEFIQRIAKWVARRFGRQAPSDLVDRIVSVRLEARTVLDRRWPLAFIAAYVGQGIVYSILLVSIRVVGIGDDVVSWADVLLAYAITSIVTLIPITPGGLGIAELTLVAVFTAIAGREVGNAATAGVILYRLATWLITIPIGWALTLRWQATSGVRLFGGGGSEALT